MYICIGDMITETTEHSRIIQATDKNVFCGRNAIGWKTALVAPAKKIQCKNHMLTECLAKKLYNDLSESLLVLLNCKAATQNK